MKRGKFMAWLVAMMIALAPAAAFADELMDLMELEELLFTEVAEVESTGFFKVKQTKAPGYTTVITAKKIEEGSARTLGELIQAHVPGMTQNAHEYFGSIIGVRGMAIDNNSKTLVMHDGQVVSHSSSFGYANEYDLPLIGDIARVEVANGPGAIVHGSGAIGGFVNMIPKNGSDFPGFVADVEYGGVDESYKTELSYGKSYGEGKDIFVYAGFVKANGVRATNEWDFDTYYKGLTDVSGWSGARALQNDITVHGNPDPSYKFSLVWNHDDFNLNLFYTDVSTYLNGPGKMYAGSGWPGTGPGGRASRQGVATIHESPAGFDIYTEPLFAHNSFETQTLGVRPKLDLSFTDTESMEISASATWMQHSYDSTQENADDLPWVDSGLDDWWGGDIWTQVGVGPMETYRQGAKEFHTQLKSVFKTSRDVPGLVSNGFALGGLVGRKEFDNQDQFWGSGIEKGDQFKSDNESEDNTWHESSIFAEDVMELTDKLLLSAGVRYDQVTYSPLKNRTEWDNTFPEKHENVSHRFAAAYEIDKDTSVKLSYQEGFRYPDIGYYTYTSYFQNVVAQHNATNSTNYALLPDLEPEKMNSTELNLYKALPDLNLKIDLNAYYNIYDKTLHWHEYYNAPDGGDTYLPKATIQSIANASGDYWFGAMANAPGKIRSIGGELKVSWQPVNWMTYDVIYGYSEPDCADPKVITSLGNVYADGDSWLRFPKHTVKLNSVFHLLDNKLLFNVSGLYNSGYSLSKNSTGYMNDVYGKSRIIVDLATRYKFTDNFSVKLNVKNALGSHVPRMTNQGDPNAGALGDERTYWYLSGKYEF